MKHMWYCFPEKLELPTKGRFENKEGTSYIIGVGQFRAFSPAYFFAGGYGPYAEESTHGVDSMR